MPELRWRFKAILETLTPLHIGDGGKNGERLEPDDEQAEPPKVATVFRDGDGKPGKPYLPGTSLKGWLLEYSRPLLDQDKDCLNALFGTTENGGAVRFFDGHLLNAPSPDQFQGARDWKDFTCVASHVVIDRKTGAAAHNLLFFEEYVPAGTTFQLEFELRSKNRQHAARFYQILADFDSGRGGSACLGAASAADWGRVRLRDIAVEAVTDARLKRWLAAESANNVPYERFDPLQLLQAVPPLAPQNHPPLALELTLDFTGAFVTNDPYRARKRNEKSGEGNKEGNITPRRLPENQPYLPHSSLHGALRSRAEKIRRTLTGDAPSPSILPPEDGSVPIVRNAEELANLDPVSLWFGAPGWRSPLQLRNQRVSRSAALQIQEMIAIDRFTGGGSNHRKFDARYFWKPEFKVDLHIDTKAVELAFRHVPFFESEAWLLLAWTLRDLVDGLITLGAGAGKGFGECRASITPKSSQGLPPGLSDGVRRVFEKGLQPGEWPDPGPCTPDPTPLERTDHAGQNQFYNPYHFCPLAAPDPKGLPTLADLASDSQLSHDRYRNGLLSGYLDCTVTAETPIFVGGKQTPRPSQPTEVEHYKRDGILAIPATSLRGLISAHLEVLTNSSLRVLDNTYYSVRKPAEEALQLRGAVVERHISGAPALFLRPLLRDAEGRWMDPDCELARASAPEPGLVRLPEEAAQRYVRIVTQLSERIKPAEPAKLRTQIKPGDWVYYRVDQNGQACEVSFSSIWRKETAKRTFDFFGPDMRDLLPMSVPRRKQRSDEKVPITLAEKLFGFVEDRTEGEQIDSPAVALAGRVRFTDARYTGNKGSDPQLPAQTLKILSSPKPPCPAMYFSKRDGRDAKTQHIDKTELGSSAAHQLKGRKFYLHQPLPGDVQRNEAPWASRPGANDDDNDQKMRVAPVMEGSEFRFRIHFENLTEPDLAALVRAIRPAPEVRYKLGLGKPLGLGTVRLDPSEKIALILLPSRYTEGGLDQSTAQHVELVARQSYAPPAGLALPLAYRALMARDYSPVSYPQVRRRGSAVDLRNETRLYEWFVANARFHSRALTRIQTLIEPLVAYEYEPPPERHSRRPR